MITGFLCILRIIHCGLYLGYFLKEDVYSIRSLNNNCKHCKSVTRNVYRLVFLKCNFCKSPARTSSFYGLLFWLFIISFLGWQTFHSQDSSHLDGSQQDVSLPKFYTNVILIFLLKKQALNKKNSALFNQ